jgi:hypothetical protein
MIMLDPFSLIIFGLSVILHISSLYIYIRNFIVSKSIQFALLVLLAISFEGLYVLATKEVFFGVYDSRTIRLVSYLLDSRSTAIPFFLIISIVTFVSGVIAVKKTTLKLHKLGNFVIVTSLVEASMFVLICVNLLDTGLVRRG